GRYKEASQDENIVVKALDNGQFLYLKDVATVELDAEGYGAISFTNGNPAISMGVYQTPGSNAQEIIEEIHTKLAELKDDFPKGVTYIVNFDTNEFLTASIDGVLITLLEAF